MTKIRQEHISLVLILVVLVLVGVAVASPRTPQDDTTPTPTVSLIPVESAPPATPKPPGGGYLHRGCERNPHVACWTCVANVAKNP